MNLDTIKSLIDMRPGGDPLAPLLQDDEFWASDEKILVLTASYLQQKGESQGAVKLIEEILIRRRPVSTKTDLDLKYIKGDCFYDLDRFQEGVHVYTEILKQVNGDVAFTNRGLAFWELQKYEDALSDYREAIKENPLNHIAMRGAGDCLLKLGELEKAKVYLKAAVKINPDYAAAYTALGAAYFKTENFKEARRNLEIALKLDPTNQRAANGLAEAEKRLNAKK